MMRPRGAGKIDDLPWPWGELSWHPFVRRRQLETMAHLTGQTLLAVGSAIAATPVRDLAAALAEITRLEAYLQRRLIGR
jgi:hypothetical protein